MTQIDILLITKAALPTTAGARFYKISCNTLYATHEAEPRKTWHSRPEKTLAEEKGTWLSLDTFSSSSCTIVRTGRSHWTLTPTNFGDSPITLRQMHYWRTPGIESPKLDPKTGLGAEITRLWGDGQITYMKESGTLYCKEKDQEYGITNFHRIVKQDRNSGTWFIYDKERDDFEPVASLLENEMFVKLPVESLEENMFKAGPSRAWQTLTRAADKVVSHHLPALVKARTGSAFGFTKE
jgi:hypothetical protein